MLNCLANKKLERHRAPLVLAVAAEAKLQALISNESLLVILVVGLVAGWLASKIVRGAGFGLIGGLVIGIIGAFIGAWLLPGIGIHLGTELSRRL